jgi:ABC-type Fe3+ transport system permease subunit
VTPLAVSAMVWVFILIPLIVVWAIGLVDIFRRDLPGGHKAVWILVVLLLPVVGTITYFVMRKPTEAEIKQAQQAGADRRRDWPSGLRR